jgi:hypothetical protein
MSVVLWMFTRLCTRLGYRMCLVAENIASGDLLFAHTPEVAEALSERFLLDYIELVVAPREGTRADVRTAEKP